MTKSGAIDNEDIEARGIFLPFLYHRPYLAHDCKIFHARSRIQKEMHYSIFKYEFVEQFKMNVLHHIFAKGLSRVYPHAVEMGGEKKGVMSKISFSEVLREPSFVIQLNQARFFPILR